MIASLRKAAFLCLRHTVADVVVVCLFVFHLASNDGIIVLNLRRKIMKTTICAMIAKETRVMPTATRTIITSLP